MEFSMEFPGWKVDALYRFLCLTLTTNMMIVMMFQKSLGTTPGCWRIRLATRNCNAQWSRHPHACRKRQILAWTIRMTTQILRRDATDPQCAMSRLAHRRGCESPTWKGQLTVHVKLLLGAASWFLIIHCVQHCISMFMFSFFYVSSQPVTHSIAMYQPAKLHGNSRRIDHSHIKI